MIQPIWIVAKTCVYFGMGISSYSSTSYDVYDNFMLAKDEAISAACSYSPPTIEIWKANVIQKLRVTKKTSIIIEKKIEVPR
jgi:hypothetical protein